MKCDHSDHNGTDVTAINGITVLMNSGQTAERILCDPHTEELKECVREGFIAEAIVESLA